MEITQNTNPTPEEIKSWEEQYGKLLKMTVMDEDENHVFYFKKNISNKRAIITLANKKLTETKDFLSYAEIIIKNSIVNGADVIKSNENILFAICPQVEKIISGYNVQLGE